MKKKLSRNIYYKYLTIDNIYNSYLIVKKTCKNKKDLYEFNLNLYTNIYNIYKDLYNKNYIFNKYKTFMIFEPKARLVMSQSISDKIVNHFITNYYLIPYLESSLIDSSVATRKNKGSGYARYLLNEYFTKLLVNSNNREIYCLKIDISKYFYSIDHNILINKLSNKILDKDVIDLLSVMIKSTNEDYINNNILYYNNKYNTDIPYYINNKGLSIGAMSNQFLAIYFLNDIHHFIKEKLRCKYFISYMDDFIILSYDKDYLVKCFNLIEEELNKINLKMNRKSNIYKLSNGFNFLGYRYKIINNNLYINYSNMNYYKLKNKYFNLYEKDSLKFYKTLPSFYSSYKVISNIEGINFKMKVSEIYNLRKEDFKDKILLIKEGIFYRAYNEDSVIMNYIFGYKRVDNYVGFGTSCYDKVIDKLREIGIGFVVIDKDCILLINNGDNEVYDMYIKLSNKVLKRKEKEEKLINKIKSIDFNKYDIIDEYLDKLI